MSESNEAPFRAAIDELWNQKDESAVDRYVSESFVGRNPDGDLDGREAFRELYNTYRTAFPDCGISIQQVLSDGDSVVGHFVFQGTHTGELMGTAPSGNSVSVHGITIGRWEGGQVVEERAVWDSHSLMQQIGVA